MAADEINPPFDDANRLNGLEFVNNREATPFITGGTVTNQGEFPSVVSIQTPAVPLSHCTGVIIDASHILTSARCVFNNQNELLNPFWLRVIAGDLNIMVPSYRRFTTNITHIYPHPQFNPATGNNDIAVLRVGPTRSIKCIKLCSVVFVCNLQ